MTRRYPLIALVVLSLLSAAGSGCANTPRGRWVQQREAITLAQDGLVELHKNNVLSDNALLAVDPWMRAARKLNWQAYYLLDVDVERAESMMETAAVRLRATETFVGGQSSAD